VPDGSEGKECGTCLGDFQCSLTGNLSKADQRFRFRVSGNVTSSRRQGT
jgi:hypothetical protein